MALQLGLGAVLGGAPALDAPVAEIQSYLVDDGTDVLVAATMGTLSAFFFILFLGAVRAFLRTAEGAPGSLSTIAFGAGLVTITLATTAGLPTVALAWDDTAALADPGLVQAAWNLNTLALVPIGSSAGALCIAAAVIILRTRATPAWVGWIGVLAGVVSVIATFFLLTDDPDSVLGTPANLGGLPAHNAVHRPAEHLHCKPSRARLTRAPSNPATDEQHRDSSASARSRFARPAELGASAREACRCRS